jgi:putative oligomerization/nucleic acid binding protein
MLGRRRGRPGLLGTVARTAVVAGTATAVAGGVSRRSARRAGEAEPAGAEAPEGAAAPAEAPPAAMPVEDQVAKIKALGELKESGLLTDEEFAAEKAKVLAL